MKKLICKIILNSDSNINPYNIKYELRSLAKTKFNFYYYQKTKKAKNIGCILFGQPNRWKGLYSQAVDKSHKTTTIKITLDSNRVDNHTF